MLGVHQPFETDARKLAPLKGTFGSMLEPINRVCHYGHEWNSRLSVKSRPLKPSPAVRVFAIVHVSTDDMAVVAGGSVKVKRKSDCEAVAFEKLSFIGMRLMALGNVN